MTKKKRKYAKPKLLPKPKRKVKLPCDRTGAPITVGDVLAWDGGERMRVAVLNYYGEDFTIGMWTAEGEGEDEFSDNLGASLVVWRGGAS